MASDGANAEVSPVSIYKYGVDACDVRDRAALERFRRKIDNWNVLFERDTNAITQQMGLMLWQDASWRCVNEARRFCEKDGSNASLAPLLAKMLDHGYVTGQVISIAKLVEAWDGKNPAKAVVSLRRLADELRADRELMTREHFVAQDALPYDYIAAAERDTAPREISADGLSFRWEATAGPEGWGMAEWQHEFFDRLSGVAPERRTRDDLISIDVFDRMDAALRDPLIEDIRTLRHKSVAHAADAFSRSKATNLSDGLSLDDFQRAHGLLLGVYEALSVVLFGSSRGTLAVPQYDLFELCDRPFIQTARTDELREFWQQLDRGHTDLKNEEFDRIIPPKS